MANCSECGKKLGFLEGSAGICRLCVIERHYADQEMRGVEAESQRASGDGYVPDDPAALAAIVLTTESSHNLDIAERLEIIAAECVLGMNIFKDIGSAMRDLIGGRNEAYQTALRDARKSVLTELKREALKIGADAVVAVDLDYSEISGGGKSMLFLVASGTAVRLNR